MPIEPINAPQSWLEGLQFERLGSLRRALKAAVIHPLANYFPAAVQKVFFRFLRSELAAANWADPGGWKSMVICYQNRRRRLADKLLCTLGTIPMALRNRRKLGGRVLARLIAAADREPVEILCLGAGPGHVVHDALNECDRLAKATLVDLSSGAFDHGRELATRHGTHDRVRFIQGDVRDVAGMLDRPPDIVQMLGICEYLDDQQIRDIALAVAAVMPRGSAIVFNSISDSHGTDRFFRRVFGLRMIHRSPEHLQDLFRSAGFSDFAALPEPLGVYEVIIGRKTGD
ncbi:MAG: methyltransferase domain-containing protein [Planctomycetota bacterium]|nr:methyltransferase domain-containing protein [Planctomycetota bacterium]